MCRSVAHSLVISAVLLLLCDSVAAQTIEGEYSLRGSLGRRSFAEVTGSSLPLNKRYDELTTEQKDIVNLWYEHIGPGDEPPFPMEGLKSIYEPFAELQARLHVVGDLVLVATVGQDGTVVEVKTYRSPTDQVTRVASSILLLTKFKPALCRGKPCKMDFPVEIAFKSR